MSPGPLDPVERGQRSAAQERFDRRLLFAIILMGVVAFLAWVLL
jgi:hypothetical protein